MSKVKGAFKGNKKTKKFIPNLTATPNHVCFKNYEERKVYKEFIQIVNHDMKTYHVGMKFDNPDEIKVTIVGNSSKTQLNSGDDILLEVEFTPIITYKKESVDRRYEICLSIFNGNARFLIPILVLSSHPEINFPREITFPSVSIHTPAYSNIFVLNYSNLYTKFSFECRNNVKIIPDCKLMGLKSCEGSTYLIEFIPKTIGIFREKIFICMENDKRVAITLKCNVIPINIFLDEEIIEFSPTFIGMSDRKLIHIVNNSEDVSFFEWIPSENLHNGKNEMPEAHLSLKSVEIFPMSGELQPGTITAIDLTFKPEDSDEDEFEILKDILVSFSLILTLVPHYHPSFNIRGIILGPTFQLDKRAIDIHELFTGESRSIEINVKNSGVISGKIFLQNLPNEIVRISPTHEFLKPGESKNFKMIFLAKKIGKFIKQIFIKVKNGEKLSLSIQGIIRPLEISIEPEFLNFTLSAICVPQMKFLKVKNKLPFDIDVVIECEKNGCESPLEFLEFFKSNSIENEENLMESPLSRTSVGNFMQITGKLNHLCGSVSGANDGIVTIFNKVDEYLERKEIVGNLIQMLFQDKIDCEIEKQFIIEAIFELLIANINDSDFIKFNNKDWAIPDDPRQIDCNKRAFKLKAGATDEIKVFLTPNYVGKFIRNLKFHLNMSGNQQFQEDIDQSIKNIKITFECFGAEIKIHNQNNEISGYAESEIIIEIMIENVSNIDGFFLLSPYKDNQMEIRSSEEKFHIAANTEKIINLHVMPMMSGQILKYVNIIALGSNRKFPICIDCKSLSPDIVIKPNKIFHNDLDVLRQHDTRILIENRSCTKARFFVKLERENECFNINPRGGILSSKQCVIVMLEKFFHDPGDYRDVLFFEIVNSKVIKIPIKCIVRKLPIIIEPSLTDIIDFGSLFLSKTPYFLDYKFTNNGKNSYMIFLILKNWRNRNNCHFIMVPNRFELSPNCSQMVKFLLTAEHAVNCEEEFTVEGCSIHYPLRDLIWESKLKASIIKPTINFAKNELIFDCYFGETGDLSIETIKITNKSNLPLPVVLKIDGEFSIYLKKTNSYEKKIMFDLKVYETREIFISFNSNLIKSSNIFHTYEGKVKAFSLGKLQCTLKLIANMIYPEIELSTNDVQFTANILPYSSSFIISNPNKHLSASFCFSINKDATKIISIHERRQKSLLNIVQCLMSQKNNLRYKFFHDEGADDDDVKFNGIINVTNKDILEYFKSITVKAREEDYSNDGNILSMAMTDKNFLLLSQMSGILRANESRLISLYFNGNLNAFNLSTTIKCHIEGGKQHEINIHMTNCNSNILLTKTYFDLSQQHHWHEIAINNICISNISSSSYDIKLIAEKNDVEMTELIEGYVKLSSRCQMNFILDDERNFCYDLKFSIFPGCLPVFKTEFGVQVNNRPPIPITFFCKNSLPIATLLDVDRESIYNIDKSFEYECLREMFNKCVDRVQIADENVNYEEIIKAKERMNILEESKSQRKSYKRNSKQRKVSVDLQSAGDYDELPKKFELLFEDFHGRIVWREKQQKMYSAKILQMVDEQLEEWNFIVLDYPNEYPHATEIMNFIAQQGFAKSLENNEIFMAYRSIYNRFAVEKFRQMKKSLGQTRTSTAATAYNSMMTIETLPFILLEYTYDFGEIKINEIYEKTIQIYFHHQSKFLVTAAIRSAFHIQDFNVKFHQKREINNLFEIRNYDEIQLCNCEEVKRCHSFDFTEGKVHTRNISKTYEHRNEIHQVYNELCSTKEKPIERNPLILAEIFQKLPFDSDESRIVEFKITFAPTSDNYSDAVKFNEIIYLDIHLGPQIPLRITGNFYQKDHTVVDF
ncbi:hypothetical protein PVAND_004463 [Polypedilum vanderplanki]|uniref:HYDIN/VesB/CFA65-like Ig-like domain-containing protein n=1 Tax=Polypedilum vanderplanki TaxID=319348 RepID=A0A9J6BY81_POLVA|nr:hypothetical protein PVAND_004463 [Polypedilum vanderplanki]